MFYSFEGDFKIVNLECSASIQFATDIVKHVTYPYDTIFVSLSTHILNQINKISGSNESYFILGKDCSAELRPVPEDLKFVCHFSKWEMKNLK